MIISGDAWANAEASAVSFPGPDAALAEGLASSRVTSRSGGELLTRGRSPLLKDQQFSGGETGRGASCRAAADDDDVGQIMLSAAALALLSSPSLEFWAAPLCLAAL